MKLKVLKLREDAYLPVRANPTDAGADLITPDNFEIEAHSYYKVQLGIAIELPENTVGLIFARSGLGAMQGITPRNKVGVIDEKYRGELTVVLKNDTDSYQVFGAGEKIAQLVVLPVFTPEIVESDMLNMHGDRGGGFGSTGK